MSQVLFFLLSLPMAVFLFFVAPIWLFLHYRSKRQMEQGVESGDFEKLKLLTERTDKLQQRVNSLERILDAESPNWRQR